MNKYEQILVYRRIFYVLQNTTNKSPADLLTGQPTKAKTMTNKILIKETVMDATVRDRILTNENVKDGTVTDGMCCNL